MNTHSAQEFAHRRARIDGVDERLHRLVAAGAEGIIEYPLNKVL